MGVGEGAGIAGRVMVAAPENLVYDSDAIGNLVENLRPYNHLVII